MPEKKKSITVRMPLELWKAVTKKAVDEETDLQKLGVMLYERWLKEQAKPNRKDK